MAQPEGADGTYVSTGIPGLDHILGGGFLRQGFYLLQGDPGSGKTTELLHIAEKLLEEAAKSDTAPIPVIVNLSTFALPKPVDRNRSFALRRGRHD